MTNTDLTDLAEHIAGNYGLNVLPRLRVEAERDDDDFQPLHPTDVLAAHHELVALAEQVTEPLSMATVLATVTDAGEDRYVAAEHATPEDLANALMTLAAETVALRREAQRTAQQFIGVTRLARRARAQAAVDAAVASGRLTRTGDAHLVEADRAGGCPGCGIPRQHVDDEEHGQLWICLNPACIYDGPGETPLRKGADAD